MVPILIWFHQIYQYVQYVEFDPVGVICILYLPFRPDSASISSVVRASAAS